jgi:Protein of unknown function (DUF1573)
MIRSFSLLAILLGLLGGAVTAYFQTRQEDDFYEMLVSGKIPASKAVPKGAERRLVVEGGDDFDFGVMELGDTRSHVFKIRNNSEKPVRLSIVETTCKCTVGSIPKESIPPGGVGEVTLEWTAKLYAPDFRQSATLQSDDEIEQLLTLSVHGDVLEVVHAEPMTVTFPDVSFGGTRSQDITVVAFDSPELSVQGVEWLDPAVAANFDLAWKPMSPEELVGEPKPLAGLIGTLMLKPGMPMGPFREELTLRLQGAKPRVIGIPVEGRITSDVSIFGGGYNEEKGILELGVIPQGDGTTRRLRIMVKGDHRESFTVNQVQTEPSDTLVATIKEDTASQNPKIRTYLLDIEVKKEAKPMSLMGIQGRRAGKVTITTNHPVAKVLNIEVRFAVIAGS